jgi:hypothetical protein
MKWHHPVQFEQRTREVFAWKPTRIKRDTVWLETYYVIEKFVDGKWKESERGTLCTVPH